MRVNGKTLLICISIERTNWLFFCINNLTFRWHVLTLRVFGVQQQSLKIFADWKYDLLKIIVLQINHMFWRLIVKWERNLRRTYVSNEYSKKVIKKLTWWILCFLIKVDKWLLIRVFFYIQYSIVIFTLLSEEIFIQLREQQVFALQRKFTDFLLLLNFLFS